MPKKEDKLSLKKLLNQLMERSIQSIISVVAQQAEHLVGLIKDIPIFKRRIKHMLAGVAFFTAGLVISGIAIAMYLEEIFPNLVTGMPYILIGFVFILTAAIFMEIK
ncbi:hypothetical protein CMO93_05795 [Candidatus Woesearchaeota archaeon]|nr:hypothetical protein [Candidatus Woesearchaeota archaeon]|tara:strand:+ start:4365 stop:4685 length:321 start_codon:yes stop_codon:yes gene_type:complete